jgi:hypothetical protein
MNTQKKPKIEMGQSYIISIREQALSLAITVIKNRLEAWRDHHKLELQRCNPEREQGLKNKIKNYQDLIDTVNAALETK